MTHRSISTAILLAVVALLGVATAENATVVAAPGVAEIGGMVEVANVPQTPTAIEIPEGCGFTVTVITSDTVTVSTSEENLVTVSTNGDSLTFNYEVDYLSEGGIVIGMPAGQLTEVSANGNAVVQITSGFTAVGTLKKTGNGELMADLSSNQVVSSIEISGNGFATMVGNFEGGTVSGNAIALISGSWKDGTKSGNGSMTIDGDVVNLNSSGNGDVSIYGDVSEGGTRSSNGSLYISGTVTSGSLENSGNGNVVAGSCDNIASTGNGGCSVSTTLVNESPVAFNEVPKTSRKDVCCSWMCSNAAFVGGTFHVSLTVVAAMAALAW